MKEYFIYGVLVNKGWYENWEAGTNRKFPVGIYGNNFCQFIGRDGELLIVGRKLKIKNNDNPIIVPELSDDEKQLIEDSVKNDFGIEGEFHYYFVKNT